MLDLKEFAHKENTKNKILTIAKEILDIKPDTISESVLDEVVEQTIYFINDMENIVENEEENALYIIADLFVANIITTALMSEKLQQVMAAYEELNIKYKELKDVQQD